MRHFSRIAVETTKVESMETPIEKWRKKGGGTGLTDDMDGSGDVEDGDEAKLGRKNAAVGVCADENWAGELVVVTADCPYEADVVESAIDTVLWRNDVEELNKGKLFEDIVRRAGKLFCEAEKGDEFGKPHKEARADMVGRGLHEGCFEDETGLFDEGCSLSVRKCGRV